MNKNNNEKKSFIIYQHLIPSDVNLVDILSANPPDFVYNFDFLLHLIHLTIEIPARNKNKMSKSGYVPFLAEILQSKNRLYKEHLDYLVKVGVLEKEPNFDYIPGIRSRCYRIAEKYLSNQLKQVEITDPKFIKLLERNNKIDFEATIKYKNLYQWFDGLRIDSDRAINYCLERLAEQRTENYYQAYSKAYSRFFKIRLIENGNFWFNIDAFGQRLHTNMTNIDGELKQFITYRGIPLVSVDIKNSQPFMSLKLLQDGTLPTHYNYPITLPYLIPPIMLVNQSKSITDPDVSKYIGLVASGTLYDFIAVKLREVFGNRYFDQDFIYDYDKGYNVKNNLTPRNRAKREVFQIFFSPNKSHTREKNLFKELFPTVMTIFEQYKSNGGLNTADGYKALAKELQRTESNLMLNEVAKEITRLRPDMPFYTIHDSVVTTVGNEHFVNDVMSRVLTAGIGYTPILDTQYWCKDCSDYKMAA